MSLRLVFAACVVSLISVSAQNATCATSEDLSALATRVEDLLNTRLTNVDTALATLLARTETTVTTAAATTQATTVTTAPTTPGATSVSGNYTFFPTTLKWIEARDHCRSLGGDLASVHSAEDETQMRAAVPDATAVYWVGINDEDDDGAVAWSDGSALDYTLSWGFNHPQKGECGALTSSDLLWWDVPCISTYPFVCQML